MRLGVYNVNSSRPGETERDGKSIWDELAVYNLETGEWSEDSSGTVVRQVPAGLSDPHEFRRRVGGQYRAVRQPESVAAEPEIIVERSEPSVSLDEGLERRAQEGYMPGKVDRFRWEPVYDALSAVEGGSKAILKLEPKEEQEWLNKAADVDEDERVEMVRSLVEE